MNGTGLCSCKNAPLKFERILFTSPLQYADRVSASIQRLGGRPVWLPGIEITHLACDDALDNMTVMMEDLLHCDYLILPSKNAILSLLHHWSKGNQQMVIDRLNSIDAEVWAMGADADFLKELGVHRVMKPNVSSTQGIVESIKGKKSASDAGKALCIVPHVVAPLVEPDVVPNFFANLESIGLDPIRVPGYETRIGPDSQYSSAEIDMLTSGQIKAIAFTSTAESQGLSQIVGRETLLQCIQEHDILLAAHGPTTARGVEKTLHIADIDCISKDSSTFDGLAEAMAEKL